MLIQEVHAAVPGRVRYKVKGLYRGPKLKRRLESLPSTNGEIRRVKAGELTGTVLVIYDSAINRRKIAQIVEDILTEYHATQRTLRESREYEQERRQARKKAAAGKGEAPDDSKVVRLPAPRTRHRWHLLPVDEVLANVQSSERGLDPDVVERNRGEFGPNMIPHQARRSSLSMFLDQFLSLPVALLGVAAGLSAVTGGVVDAIVIVAVVGINAVTGFVTESQAERTINSLRTLVHPHAKVLRDGEKLELSAEEVVVGDILLLSPGAFVPADARVIASDHLSSDESVLTGESLPVSKSPAPLIGRDIPVADRNNMVYSGTLITGGQGRAVVVAVGVESEIGKVQALLTDAGAPETPIERQLNTIGNELVVISVGVCGLVFFMGLMRGRGLLEMFKTAISLAVAAVPEGLPTVATTTLAIGIQSMKRHKVLIRNLDAVPTLGAVQTICMDKTGTITHNRMTVMRVCCGIDVLQVNDGIFRNGGGPVNPRERDELLRLLHVSVLCNETRIDRNGGKTALHGSATENALIMMAMSAGIDVEAVREQHPLRHTIYRSDDRLYMGTVHRREDKPEIVALKGSPLEVLNKCSEYIHNGERKPLSEDDREWIETENENMAGDALRVLGIAYAYRNGDNPGTEKDLELSVDAETTMIWLGLVGMADPIRNGVKEAIEAFHHAGLETVMITGDQSATAYAIGRELNLNQGNTLEIMDSADLARVDPETMKAVCKDVNIFSRVSPANKLQIVQALQSTGKIIAMTGDGINDGPALKAADIGIAMGTAGTDVAREVADVVLEEDDVQTLVIAMGGGRSIYENIRKALHFLLATNFSEILVMFAAGAVGLQHPLTAIQLLWINLLSDIFPGLALAMEPQEPDIMSRPPRDPDEPIVTRQDYKRIAFEAGVITAGSMAAYGYGIARYGSGPAATTIAFQSLTNAQILHALSCRSETHRLYERDKMPPNPYLTAAVAGSVGLQVLASLVPGMRRLLGLTPLTAIDAAVISGSAVVPLVVNEFTKTGGHGEAE